MSNINHYIRSALAVLLLISLAACGGGSGDGGGNSNSGSDSGSSGSGGTNQQLNANAGADRDVRTGTTVTLDGSDSTVSSGGTLDYRWSFISKPSSSNATLSRASSVTPTFTADTKGNYVVELAVDSRQQNSDTDRVTITATDGNTRPTADAGDDQSVKTGTPVRLDGVGSKDADGDSLSYRWTLKTPGSSQAALSGASTRTPSFTPDQPGQYVASLVVRDGTVSSRPASVTITASQANSAPVANAGDDQSVDVNEMATLDGSGSSDADDDSLNYKWDIVSSPDGSSAGLANPNSAKPSLTTDATGDYVIRLTVDDGQASDTDSVIVSSVPVLDFFVFDGGNGNYESAPNKVGVQFTISGSSDSFTPSNVRLARFRFTSTGDNFTVENVNATVLESNRNTAPTPVFTNLSESTVVVAGNNRDFSINATSVPSGAGTYVFRFTFTVQETGEAFEIVARLTVQ